MSIRNRLTGLFVMVIVVPLVLALLYLYLSGIESERRRLESTAVEQIGASIERDLQLVDNAANIMATNPTIRAYLSTSAESQIVDDQFDEMNALRNIISITDQSRPIHAIRLFMQENKLYIADQISFFTMDSFWKNPQFANASGGPYFTGVYTQAYLGQGSARVISSVRLIMHETYIMRAVGAVAVDMRASYLLELLNAWGGERVSRISLLDIQGEVIVTTNGGAYVEPARGYTLSRDIVGTSWRLVATFDTGLHGLLFSREHGAVLPVGVYIVAAAVLMLVIAMLVVRRISGRIGRMVEVFSGVKRGKMEEQEWLQATSTSHGIFSSIDRAVDEAQQMLISRQAQERAAMRMELKLLQAQINPHFLYNTLDSIGWMIQGEQVKNASQAIVALAKYLRLALSRGSDVITVRQEMEMARLYAWIQSQRQEGALEIACVLEPEAEACLLPKMTLQPIIENAILHGHATRIDIDIYAEGDRLVLSVSDNGVGLDKDEIADLLTQPDPNRGYGIYNVNQRIQLFSDQAHGCGIEVDSEKGRYTTFTLQLARIVQDHNNGA